jgi:hypothetical protein
MDYWIINQLHVKITCYIYTKCCIDGRCLSLIDLHKKSLSFLTEKRLPFGIAYLIFLTCLVGVSFEESKAEMLSGLNIAQCCKC